MMEPILVFPSPAPPELAQCLDLSGWVWKGVSDEHEARTDEPDGGWAGAAHVKVVGSGDGRIRSGETDLRGIFVADGLRGRATVRMSTEDIMALTRGA